MTTLYNCRHSGDQFRITKFDTDMNVQSSYLCTETECECPAGARHSCRHRDMLPRFIERSMVDQPWMYDYDRGGWVMTAIDEDLVDAAPAAPRVVEPAPEISVAQPIPSRINRRGF